MLVKVGSNRLKRNGLNQLGDFIDAYVILEKVYNTMGLSVKVKTNGLPSIILSLIAHYP